MYVPYLFFSFQAAVRPGRGAVGAYGKEVTGPKFGG